MHGTNYQKTFARNLTSLTFENFLKLTILILRLTFNNITVFYHYLRVSAVIATATWLAGWLSVTAGIVSKRVNLS